MLNDAEGFNKVMVAAGYMDLRREIKGLATIIRYNIKWIRMRKMCYSCSAAGRATRSKDYCRKGDGFLLLYKRLERGSFSWPRTTDDILKVTPEQYRYLMKGFEIVAKHPNN